MPLTTSDEDTLIHADVFSMLEQSLEAFRNIKDTNTTQSIVFLLNTKCELR